MRGVLALAAAGCGSDDDDGGDDGGGPARRAEPSRLAIELSGSAKKPTLHRPEVRQGRRGRDRAHQLGQGDARRPARPAPRTATRRRRRSRPARRGARTASRCPTGCILAGGIGDVPSGETATVTQELPPGKLRRGRPRPRTPTPSSRSPAAPAPASVAADGGTIDRHRVRASSPTGLKAGTQRRSLFDNAGQEPHFIAAARIQAGQDDRRRASKFFETEKGEPPIDESRSFDDRGDRRRREQSVELDLEDGPLRPALLRPRPRRAARRTWPRA